MTLEQMKLDRGDEQTNYDPFYNPGGVGAQQTGIQLEAQNAFMNKDTAQKLKFQSPDQQQQHEM